MEHDFGISVPRVKWIFDPSFHYTPSYATDLRKTFARIRNQLESSDREDRTRLRLRGLMESARPRPGG